MKGQHGKRHRTHVVSHAFKRALVLGWRAVHAVSFLGELGAFFVGRSGKHARRESKPSK